MDTPSRRRILNAIAALAVVPIGGEDKHGAYAAIEAFQEADAERIATSKRVEMLKAELAKAELELTGAESRYTIAAVEVGRVLRLILQARV
jgi:hypothetical protein